MPKNMSIARSDLRLLVLVLGVFAVFILGPRVVRAVWVNMAAVELSGALQQQDLTRLQQIADTLSDRKRFDSADSSITRILAVLCAAKQPTACQGLLASEQDSGFPTDPLLSYWRGESYAFVGDMKTAYFLWKQAGAAPYFFYQARASVAAGAVEKALVQLETAVNVEPQVSDAFYLRGWIFERQGRWQEAEANYAQAISNQSFRWTRAADSVMLAKTYVGFGFVEYQLTGDLTRATASLQMAITVNPEEPWAFIRLCDVYRLAGDASRALEACDEAIRILPDQQWAFFSRARVFILVGQNECAKHDLETVLRFDPTYAPAQELLAEIDRD